VRDVLSISAHKISIHNLFASFRECRFALPTPLDDATKKSASTGTKCRKMIPLVKTFAWRLLRRVIPSTGLPGTLSILIINF
jgi:hypothetical protein